LEKINYIKIFYYLSLMEDMIEPLLDPANERFTIHPIKHPDIWNMYKEQLAAFWRAEEIDYSNDYQDFILLEPEEQHFIKMILAFFASSDGIVNFNLRERFLNEIKITEAQVAYGFQLMMENIHGEVYSLMLENIVKNAEERYELFNAIKSIEPIKLMAEWAIKWIHSDETIGHRIIAFAIVEGIFFSGAFAAIFWLKKYRNRGKNIMPGLIKSNILISRDEGSHCRYACLLYSKVVNRLTKNVVHNIFDEAVNISKNFNKNAIRCDLIGMNLKMMDDYIEYVADTLLSLLDYEKKYNTENPFPFMESIALATKANFFETKPVEYQSAFNPNNVNKNELRLLEDF
jgi:Ribonucleotide reductase, beta subunit